MGNEIAAANAQVLSTDLPMENESVVIDKILLYEETGETAIIENYSTLLAIAQQCPYSGGNAVFTARGMLDMIDPNLSYDDDGVCLQQGIYRLAGKEKETILPDVQLIPNPANETVKIVLHNAKEGICTVRLHNFVGEVVYDNSFNCIDSEHAINIAHFASGLYNATVQVQDKVYKNLKLVIVH